MTTPLAEWILQQLQDRDLSQAEFSAQAGIPKANVHYILAKSHVPGHDTLQRIADFFGVSVFYIYQLAGLLPREIDVEQADATTLAVLNEAARTAAKMPEATRRRYLQQIRAITAFVDQVVVPEEETIAVP